MIYTSTKSKPRKLTKSQRDLQASWEKLVATHTPRTQIARPKVTGSIWYAQTTPPRGNTPHINSVGDQVGNGTKPVHSKQLSTTVTIAPICNKGAYQVITDSKDFLTMGRKV